MPEEKTRDRLLDKLGKIKKMADGAAAIGSEAEAQSFADMLNKLLLDNKLEMTDLEFEQFEKEQPVETSYINYTLYPDVRIYPHRVAWTEQLARIIAEAHFCRILLHPHSSRITLVGRREDTVVAEYLFIVLMRALDKIERLERRKFRRETQTKSGDGFRDSFIQAFLMRLRDRFLDLRRARNIESTALMRLKKSDKAVAEYIEKNYDRTAKALSVSTRFHREATVRGRAAADKVNLKASAIEGGGVVAAIGGKQRYWIKINESWSVAKTGSTLNMQPGWLFYELYDGTKTQAAPGTWVLAENRP